MTDHYDQELLTYEQAARFLSLSPTALYRLVSQKSIPYVRLGPRTIRFSKNALVEWLQELASKESEIGND